MKRLMLLSLAVMFMAGTVYGQQPVGFDTKGFFYEDTLSGAAVKDTAYFSWNVEQYPNSGVYWVVLDMDTSICAGVRPLIKIDYAVGVNYIAGVEIPTKSDMLMNDSLFYLNDSTDVLCAIDDSLSNPLDRPTLYSVYPPLADRMWVYVIKNAARAGKVVVRFGLIMQ